MARPARMKLVSEIHFNFMCYARIGSFPMKYSKCCSQTWRIMAVCVFYLRLLAYKFVGEISGIFTVMAILPV